MADLIGLSQKKVIRLESGAEESSDEMIRDRKHNEKRRARSTEAAFPSTKWVQADDDDRDNVYRAVDRSSMGEGSPTVYYESLHGAIEEKKYDPYGNKKPFDFNFIGGADPNPVLSISVDDERSDVYRAAGRVSSYNSMDNFSMGVRGLKGPHSHEYRYFEDSRFESVGIKKTSDLIRVSDTKPISSSKASSPQRNEPFAVPVRPKQTRKKKVNLAHVVDLALLENKKIKKLSTFYNKCNSIVLQTEIGRESEEYVKETFALICTKMYTLPHMTFTQHNKELKIRGSYYYAYEVCYFDATVWKVGQKYVKSDMPEKEYIIEFRRRSLTGLGAFEQLLRRAAGWLFEEKRAVKYGNGFKIYPYAQSPLEMGDGVDDEIFDSPLPSSVEETSESDSSCQITLNSELVCSWANTIKERSTYSEENIRILAICTKDRENTELMASEPKLHEALSRELNHGRNATSCANTLIIVKAIFDIDAEAVAKSFLESKMLLSVTKCLLQHSNCNLRKSDYKSNGLRSVAIERAALRVLKMLTEYQELWFPRQEVEKVLKKLEKYQGYCTGGLEKELLNAVFKGLKVKV